METKNKKTGETQEDIFDGVMICTGHHADAYIPSFPGDDEFQVFHLFQLFRQQKRLSFQFQMFV